MAKYVFDDEVLGLSFRNFHEPNATRIFCSKVVVTDTGVEAYIKSKKSDILIWRVKFDKEGANVWEGSGEVVIRTSEYVCIVLRHASTFLEPEERIFETEWENCLHLNLDTAN